MKKLLLGNEAVARGLYEAGCSFLSSIASVCARATKSYARQNGASRTNAPAQPI